MTRPLPLRLLVVGLLALLGATGCAPKDTNTTFSGQDIGRAAQIRYGTIVSVRPVAVQADKTGVGAIGGGALGGVAGSFIGGASVVTNILGAVGGALIGGFAGNAVEGAAGKGTASEFIVRADGGETLSIVQTNELQLQPGERVILTLGARTRLARAAPTA